MHELEKLLSYELTSYWQLLLADPSPSSTLCNCRYVLVEPEVDVGAG